MGKSLYWIFSIFYALIFLVFFAIVPYIFLHSSLPEYVELLTKITIASVLSFLIALNLPFGYRLKLLRLKLNFNSTIYVFFSIFLLLIVVVFSTAEKIPIIESIKGADAADLSYYRELFLKSRTGWQSSLVYFNAIITGAILPYLIAIAFERNHRHKFIFAALFFLYCISFIEKAYFIKLAIPVFFVYLSQVHNKKIFIVKGSIIIFILTFFMFLLSGSAIENVSDDPFWSMAFTPVSPMEQLFFRSIVVPIITSLDALRVFIEDFKGSYFYGSTSTFLALITGQERINFERSLFEVQFGQNLTETGNANSTFMIEAYINFGLPGVILFSFILGKLIRFAIKSKDIAMLSIMPLFIFYLYNAGLIGTMLSNGFLFLFLIVRFVKFR